jgi:NitT/TauT family transport system permease protein
MDKRAPLSPPVRAEFEHAEIAAGNTAEVQRKLSAWERIANIGWVRKSFILLVLAAAWEAYARYIGNALMFPTFSDAMVALWDSVTTPQSGAKPWFTLFGIAFTPGVLVDRIVTTLKVLLIGYGAGLLLAGLFTSLAITTRFGRDLLETLTSMFNPLPAIALLPLALLWFGLGIPSLVFVIIHSVLWAVSLNTHTGFMSVSETQRMAGQNYGLRGLGYVMQILIPAAFASILAGLKIGWAFAWRTLIAAELVFGVSSRSGGLGWFIFENRNQLETAYVFAGLTAVIIIGLVVENVVFRSIEARTVRRWGMQR